MLAAHALFHDDTNHDLSPEPEVCAPRPHFFKFPSGVSLESFLSSTHSAFFEVGRSWINPQDIEWLHRQHPHFSLSLTSESAYRQPLAQILTDHLYARFGLSQARKMQILTCMQEAITNAIVHGNFCIQRQCESLEDFEIYYAEVERCLADHIKRELRVLVRAWDFGQSLKIGFSHSGAGKLSSENLYACHPAITQKSGRGLFLIQSLAEQVWCDDNGHSLYVSFPF